MQAVGGDKHQVTDVLTDRARRPNQTDTANSTHPYSTYNRFDVVDTYARWAQSPTDLGGC